MCDPEDRGTIILFGDGAGAVVIGASDTPGISPPICMPMAVMASCSNCRSPVAACRVLSSKPMYMKGNDVFKVAVTRLSEIVTETLAAANVEPSELDWLVPHQANFRIINATAEETRHGARQGDPDPGSSWQYLRGLRAHRLR